jgi:enamine deaminase RidA (YjgF/YER057c/UK114 family)
MKGLRTVLIAAGAAALVMLAAVGATQDSSAPQYLNLPGRSDDLPYSNAVLVGDTLYLSGAIGRDPETGAVPEDVEEEIRIVLDSMKSRLEMVGMSMDDLVQVRVYCPDLTLYDTFNTVYRTYFSDHYPARAFIGSGPLLSGGRFELTGIAVRK